MTDSVEVFPPGYRLTDSATGAPLSGGVLYFYDAGTNTAKTVYSDKDLITSLGTSITTDALGYPTSDGSTKTLIYVGTSAYKVVIKNSAGSTVAEHDNIKGAVTTIDSTSLSVTSTRPVIAKSLDYAVVSGDQNKIIPVNCSGGDVTITLPSAVTVGSGWGVTIQHAGSANQVLVATVSSQTLTSGVTSFGTVMALSLSGEELTVVSDGSNWRVVSYVSPNIKRAQGILTVTNRLTAPPGSEVQGDLYLISGAPTGAWSSFAAGDIVQYTNSAWVKFTPTTDNGWVAFNKSDNKNYQYRDSAWVDMLTTDVPTRASTPIALTPVTVSSGSPQTYVDFTGIPSWAKRVTVLIKNLTNSSGAKATENDYIFQLGVGTTPTTSGYKNNPIKVWYGNGGLLQNLSSAGFGIYGGANQWTWSGKLDLVNLTSNTWVASGIFGTTASQTAPLTNSDYDALSIVAGHIDLSGSLGMIRITTDNGTSGGLTNGVINVLYE